jgi:hypothetical protein
MGSIVSICRYAKDITVKRARLLPTVLNMREPGMQFGDGNYPDDDFFGYTDPRESVFFPALTGI